jgi:His-Xaa-Ser system protein HxsD
VSVDVTVDLALYPIEAVMGTAYVFVDRCYVFLDKPAEGKVQIQLTGKPGLADAELRAIAAEFQNELLSQALRFELGKRHERVRELLMARALFGAAPKLDAEGDRADGLGPDELDDLQGTMGEAPAGEGAGDPQAGGGPRRWRAAGQAGGEGGGPQDPLPDDGDDYLDDPLGIAVSWEEKYAKSGESAAPAPGGAAGSGQSAPAKGADDPTTGGSGAGRA